MPFIKQVNRPKFAPHIMSVLGVLKDPNDTLYSKGEFFGYFVNRVCRRYLADPDYTKESFHSAFFNLDKKKALANCADSIAAMITRSDPISGAGELNYPLTAIYWGFLGEAEGFAMVGYGLRAYLKGVVERIRSTIDSPNGGSQKDATMAFRRHLVIRGVLTDIMDETYITKTRLYEDTKLAENGPVWLDGKLVLPESTDMVSQ